MKEPVMRDTNVPTYFRACVLEARTSRNGYADAGWHLAIHLDEHVEATDLERLGAALTSNDPEGAAWRWFARNLPGCAALVPRRRWSSFMKGIELAIDQGRLAI
jgi:hypothetical protein